MEAERIRVKHSLGKSPGIFGISPRFVLPWGVIFVSCWLLYLLTQQITTPDPLLFFLLAIALLIAHWILYGDRPWEFGGKFHQPQDVAIGGGTFNFAKTPIKSKVGSKRVGAGTNQRYLKPFEDLLDLAGIVRFDLKGEQVGAFLLQNADGEYRMVFGFDCLGFNSTLTRLEAQKICKQIEEGLKDLPYGEELTINAGTYSTAQARLRELSELQVDVVARASQQPSAQVRRHLSNHAARLGDRAASHLYFMLAWAKDRVATLTRMGKHNPKYVRLYMSYTLTGGTQKSADLIEKLLSQSERVWNSFLGQKHHSAAFMDLEAALNHAFHQGYFQTLEFLRSKLGLSVQAFSDEQLWRIEYLRYNSVRCTTDIPPIPQILVLEQTGLRIAETSHLHVTTELFLNGCPVLDKKWVELPGIHRYVGGAVWNKKPNQEWRGDDIAREQLFYASRILTIPDVVDSEIIVQLTSADQRQVLMHSVDHVKAAHNNANMAANRGRLDVGALFNTEKGVEAQRALLEGGHAIRFAWVGMVYRSNPQALDKALNSFCAQFTGGVVGREQEYFHEVWLECLPFKWQPMLVRPFDRRQMDTGDVVRGFMPLLLDRGVAQRGVELIAPRGHTPFYIDIFSEHKNVMILGKKGSGKSVLGGEFITHGLAQDCQVIVVDATRGTGSGSFDELTHFYGGAYFNTAKESGNLLERPDYRRFTDDPETLADIQKAFRKLAMGGLLVILSDKNEESRRLRRMNQVLNIALDAFLADRVINERYERAHQCGFGSPEWQQMPTLHDFSPFMDERYFQAQDLTDAIREEIAHIRLQLRSILTPGNALGRALATPSTFRTDAKLIVYALGGVESDEEARVYGYAAYAAALVRSWNYPKTLFVMDECSYLLNFDSFAELAANVVAVVGRKSGIRVIMLGQDIHAVRRCKTSRSILDNMNVFLVGHINEGAISDLEQEGIPRALLEHNVSTAFLPDRSEACSQWLYVESQTRLFGKYFPSFAHIAALMNEPDQVALKHEFLSHSDDAQDALARLAAQLRTQTKDGGHDAPN